MMSILTKLVAQQEFAVAVTANSAASPSAGIPKTLISTPVTTIHIPHFVTPIPHPQDTLLFSPNPLPNPPSQPPYAWLLLNSPTNLLFHTTCHFSHFPHPYLIPYLLLQLDFPKTHLNLSLFHTKFLNHKWPHYPLFSPQTRTCNVWWHTPVGMTISSGIIFRILSITTWK